MFSGGGDGGEEVMSTIRRREAVEKLFDVVVGRRENGPKEASVLHHVRVKDTC